MYIMICKKDKFFFNMTIRKCEAIVFTIENKLWKFKIKMQL